jgi:F-box-like
MTTHADLPAEILSKIFSESLPLTLDEDGRRFFQTIRSVSPRWRSISLATPILWSSLSVTSIRGGYMIDSSRFIRILDGWFFRAGSTLSLDLEYQDWGRGIIIDRASLKSLLQRYQSRWRRLSIDMRDESFLDVIADLPSSEWLSLDTLSLWRLDLQAHGADEDSQALDALDRITSLRRLHLESPTYHAHSRRYGPIHLAELQITIGEAFSANHSSLISSYASLSQLTLVVDRRSGGDPAPGAHLLLPSLLVFAYHGPDLVPLQYFTAPALVDLTVDLTGRRIGSERMEGERESFKGFLTRCTDSLKSLTLRESTSPSFIAHAIPLLSIRPSIERVTVGEWPNHTENKNFEEEERHWCPGLRQLSVLIDGTAESQLNRLEGLAALLKRREACGLPKLETLIIRRKDQDGEFPHDLFEDVGVGKVSVLVPV